MITLTAAAIAHLKAKIADQSHNAQAGFHLSIKKTGCSGYAYVPDIIDTPKAEDIHFTVQDLHVYIDRNCENFIKGVIVDYVAVGDGLKQKKLVFINPNEKNRCGCGESFTIE
jgi:iron-sulfur cluster assembly protein